MSKTGFFDKVVKKIKSIDRPRLERFILDIEKERKTLNFIFNTFREGIIVVMDNGEIFYYNKTVRELLKIERMARYLKDFDIDPNLYQSLTDAFNKAEEPVNKEVVMHTPYHRIIKLKTFSPDENINKNIKIIFLLEDITETHVKEMKFKKAQYLASLNSLSSGILHEINNPLTAMDLHVQLLEREIKRCSSKDSTRKEERKEPVLSSVQILRQEINRLKNILERFKDAVRPSSPMFRDVKILDIIEKTFSLVEHELKKSKVTFRKNMPVEVSLIRGDEEQLIQAFLNLIKNSLEAIGKNGEIDITVREDGEYIQIEIKDTGPGIKPDELQKIFEPYFTTKNTGMGLGLSIVYRIVMEHRGMIEVTNNEDSGVTFRLVFPISQKIPKLLKE